MKARATVSNFVEYVYKELQFALREAVGTRTLDELLADKGAIDREVACVGGASWRPAVWRCVRWV